MGLLGHAACAQADPATRVAAAASRVRRVMFVKRLILSPVVVG